jgi:hypothetical protein
MAKTNQTENETVDTATKTLDPKIEARKKAREDAKKRIQTFLKENSEQLGGLKADIELFIGGAPRAARGSVRSVNTDLRDAFIANGSMTEMDIFKQFRIGRPEMVAKCRVLVLCPNPDDRLWIKFDESTETYVVAGQGAEPPEGWDGYIPSSKIAGL